MTSFKEIKEGKEKETERETKKKRNIERNRKIGRERGERERVRERERERERVSRGISTSQKNVHTVHPYLKNIKNTMKVTKHQHERRKKGRMRLFRFTN